MGEFFIKGMKSGAFCDEEYCSKFKGKLVMCGDCPQTRKPEQSTL